MKLHDKTLTKENHRFEVIAFDINRYNHSKRRKLYYLIKCKLCQHVVSRSKESIVTKFDNLKCENCVSNRFGKCLNTRLYNVYSHYINNARQRDITWNLTEIEFKKLVSGDCYYCGKPPHKTKTSSYKDKSHLMNGIDRIDSMKGYSVNNCVSCCGHCNIMKNKFSQKQFLQNIVSIYNNLIKGSTTIPQGSTLQANGNGNGEILTA